LTSAWYHAGGFTGGAFAPILRGFERGGGFPCRMENRTLAALAGLSWAMGRGTGRWYGRRGWGEEFCRGVFRAEFGEGRQIDDPTVIGDILSQFHIESAPVLEAARAETIKAALRTQTEEAKQLGIFGAPSFTTADGELFWGNDRLERAIAWAKNGR